MQPAEPLYCPSVVGSVGRTTPDEHETSRISTTTKTRHGETRRSLPHIRLSRKSPHTRELQKWFRNAPSKLSVVVDCPQQLDSQRSCYRGGSFVVWLLASGMCCLLCRGVVGGSAADSIGGFWCFSRARPCSRVLTVGQGSDHSVSQLGQLDRLRPVAHLAKQLLWWIFSVARAASHVGKPASRCRRYKHNATDSTDRRIPHSTGLADEIVDARAQGRVVCGA